MTTAGTIRNHIKGIAIGEPFTSIQFNGLGTRASIDQALSRLVKGGEIVRVSRGVFVRPKNSRYVGQVMPELSKVAQAIANAHGETIQVHGAEAARLLGLTTQMPLQSLFYTSGRNRDQAWQSTAHSQARGATKTCFVWKTLRARSISTLVSRQRAGYSTYHQNHPGKAVFRSL